MFKFFDIIQPDFRLLTPNEIINILENENDESIYKSIVFTPIYNEKHGNTLLLQALAWNMLKASEKLIYLDKEKIALNTKDTWPTCLNTPIILAAKINATDIIQLLITHGADVNQQDYRGFTALHYACIYRNDEAIKALLAVNAEVQLVDAFGNMPDDYYRMDIQPTDLAYRYGYTDGKLNHVIDISDRYLGTKKPCFSALRWYLAHIISNNTDLSKFNKTALMHLKNRSPIYNQQSYEAMVTAFCEYRNNTMQNMNILRTIHLKKEVSNYFTHLHYDRFQGKISPELLVPPLSVTHHNNHIWIELQEIRNITP